MRGRNPSQLLPVAIMAHNEEKVIKKSIESIFDQKTPTGFLVKVIVVANGCVDRTEEIVRGVAKENPDRVELISISEKGKTRAINRAISFLDGISKNDFLISYIIFLDADCEFVGKEALIDFVSWFERNSKLCAVGADCLPDVFFNPRNDVVAQVYRAVYNLGKYLRINSISGMCYGIRFDILKKIEFPEFQFAEDMFISSRLSGRFIKDKNIRIVFKTPSNLHDEIERRTRQAISSQRYHEYYSYLKEKNVRVKLFDREIDDNYIWGGTKGGDIVRVWLKLRGIKPKFFVVAYFLIKQLSKIRAYMTLKNLKGNKDLDYWKISR